MIKIVPLLILLLLSNSIISAQKLKKKTRVTGNYKEVYFVEKKTEFQQGRYFIINSSTKDTISAGKYKNSRRVEEWSFSDPESSSPFMTYNYSTDELSYLNMGLLADSFLVRIGNDFELAKVDRPLLYTGFKNELNWILAKQIDIPFEVIKARKEGVSLLHFTVNKSGDISGVKIVSGFLKDVEQQINKAVMQLPGKFLPAMVNGKEVESCFYVRVNVGMPENQFASNESMPYLIHLNYTYQPVKEEKRSLGYSIETISVNEMK